MGTGCAPSGKHCGGGIPAKNGGAASLRQWQGHFATIAAIATAFPHAYDVPIAPDSRYSSRGCGTVRTRASSTDRTHSATLSAVSVRYATPATPTGNVSAEDRFVVRATTTTTTASTGSDAALVIHSHGVRRDKPIAALLTRLPYGGQAREQVSINCVATVTAFTAFASQVAKVVQDKRHSCRPGSGVETRAQARGQQSNTRQHVEDDHRAGRHSCPVLCVMQGPHTGRGGVGRNVHDSCGRHVAAIGCGRLEDDRPRQATAAAKTTLPVIGIAHGGEGSSPPGS